MGNKLLPKKPELAREVETTSVDSALRRFADLGAMLTELPEDERWDVLKAANRAYHDDLVAGWRQLHDELRDPAIAKPEWWQRSEADARSANLQARVKEYSLHEAMLAPITMPRLEMFDNVDAILDHAAMVKVVQSISPGEPLTLSSTLPKRKAFKIAFYEPAFNLQSDNLFSRFPSLPSFRAPFEVGFEVLSGADRHGGWLNLFYIEANGLEFYRYVPAQAGTHHPLIVTTEGGDSFEAHSIWTRSRRHDIHRLMY